jgi:Domain of unknown function (DUF4145)
MIQSDHLSPGQNNQQRPIADYYPKKSPVADPFVPKDIAEDYLEAQRCFMAGAWHGCAVMARRCMHSVAEHFKADGSDLYKQIEDLRAKQIITQSWRNKLSTSGFWANMERIPMTRGETS